MNANPRLRLWKEARALLPMWAGVSALMLVPFLLASGANQIGLAAFAYVFGCAVLGPVCIGQEFQHRTMAGLLAQPVSRRRIWWEKLAVCGVAFSLLTILLLLLACVALWHSGFGHMLRHQAMQFQARGAGTSMDGLAQFIESCHMTIGQWSLLALHYLTREIGLETVSSFAWSDLKWTPEYCAVLALFLAPPVLGFCTGPTCTLFARSALGGAALAFLGPWALLLIGVLLFEAFGGGVSGPDESVLLLYYALFVGSIYAAAMFLLGCRRFQRLQDVSLLAQEFAAPRQFDSMFAWLTSGLAPERGSLMANLVRKELRVQRPAFFVAAFIGVLWLMFIGLWQARPEVEAAVLLVPTILLCLGIPIITGIVSTAEERSLGVHEWHLTLPVSARRQWCVKVVVALGVNAVLGLVLPGLLAHASSWLANNPQLVADIPGRNVSPLIIGNAVIFCAALYASSASANSMRALIGTIIIFTAAGLFLPVADQVHRWLYGLIDQRGPMPPDAAYGSWYHFEQFYWPVGWVCLASWVVALGQENFRTSLASLNRPARRLAVLFLAAWLFVNAGLNGPTLLAVFFQRVGW